MIRMKKLVLRDSDSSLEVQTIDLKGAIPSLKDAQNCLLTCVEITGLRESRRI